MAVSRKKIRLRVCLTLNQIVHVECKAGDNVLQKAREKWNKDTAGVYSYRIETSWLQERRVDEAWNDRPLVQAHCDGPAEAILEKALKDGCVRSCSYWPRGIGNIPCRMSYRTTMPQGGKNTEKPL